MIELCCEYLSARSVHLTVCYYHVTSDVAPVSSKAFEARMYLIFRQTIECGFTLKRVRDMIITQSQMHRAGKYSQHSSIIWPVLLNGLVFVYELSGCGFRSCCCHYVWHCQKFFRISSHSSSCTFYGEQTTNVGLFNILFKEMYYQVGSIYYDESFMFLI